MDQMKTLTIENKTFEIVDETARKIKDGSVTSQKLAEGAVTAEKTAFDFQNANFETAADIYAESVLFLTNARAERNDNILRIATYNTPTKGFLGQGYDVLNYPVWLDYMAALFRTSADVVMLQEISTMAPYTVDTIYTQSGAFPYAYMPMYKRGDVANSDDKAVGRRNYSNAIISRYTLTGTSGGIYSYSPSTETRGYAHANITRNGKTISFYSVHFSLNAEQRAQEIDLLKTILQNDTADIIAFGGDLNIYYNNQSAELASIISLGFSALNDGKYTFPSGSLDRSIDNIYIKGNYTKVSDGVIDYTGISSLDHACYYADINIGG